MSKLRAIFVLSAVAAVAAIGVGVALADGGSAGSTRSGGCHVGSVSHLDIPRVPPHSGAKLEGPVVILACGETSFMGQSALVGFRTNAESCFSLDRVQTESSQVIGCVADEHMTQRPCVRGKVCAQPLVWFDAGTGPVSEGAGFAPRGASDITLRTFQGDEAVRRAKVLVVRWTSRLEAEVGISKPPVIFAAMFPSCPPARGVDFVIKQKDGRSLGVAHAPAPFAGACS